MPKLRMSPAWIAGLSADDDAEWIDTEQRGLVLRVRRGQMVWFVRYLFGLRRSREVDQFCSRGVTHSKNTI